MRKAVFIVLGLCLFLKANAQKQGDVWYFGDRIGVDFSSGEPLQIFDGQIANQGFPYPHSEASSVICDSDGNLQFYTDGMKVWDRNHKVMPNGNGLLGHYSSTQGVIIVPLPESKHIFYVFTTDGFYENELKNGFRYSVVDMCLNDRLGDVIEGRKNILLLDTVAEKLAAVRHTNGIDYWVIVHKYYSDAFHAFHLTQDGIAEEIVSTTGSVHPIPLAIQGNEAAIGQLKLSPDGRRLAIVNGNTTNAIAEICDFNAADGRVTGCFSLQVAPTYNYYGVSFSPDSKKLYISCTLNNNGIYQFDLTAGEGHPESVRSSRISVYSFPARALQLANNNKIYFSFPGAADYLHVIHHPNNFGLACNLEDSAIYLQGRTISFGLPNFIDSYAYTNGLVSCIEEPDTLTIPTAFTPDGDGINDAFEIAHLPAGSGLVVYSRWGREVYQSANYAGGWDAGNVTGGIYYYILTLPNGGRRKGVVHVVK